MRSCIISLAMTSYCAAFIHCLQPHHTLRIYAIYLDVYAHSHSRSISPRLSLAVPRSANLAITSRAALFITRSTRLLLRSHVRVQSRVIGTRLQTVARVVPTVVPTRHALVVVWTPTSVACTLRRTIGCVQKRHQQRQNPFKSNPQPISSRLRQ